MAQVSARAPHLIFMPSRMSHPHSNQMNRWPQRDGKPYLCCAFLGPQGHEDDEESQETLKNARSKLERSLAPNGITKVFAKSEIASEKTPNKIYGCIGESHESTRHRVESSQPKNHEDHIASKECTSMSHYNLVHKFIPMAQAMKIPDAKAAVDKEWNKLEKVHFATLMNICHLQNAELEPKLQKYKGRVVLRGDIVKRQLWSLRSFC